MKQPNCASGATSGPPWRRSMRKWLPAVALCLVALPALAAENGELESRMTHRMMMLALQLGVILFAAKVGGILFARARLPVVLGELVAGMAIGPYVLGRIPFWGFDQGLFPVMGDFPISPELYGVSCVAAIVLLFVTGLETDLRLLMRFSVAGSMVGIGGVAVSFILGDLTAVVFSRMLFGVPLGFFHPACLFLGVITTATSVGITARVFSEQRKMDSPEGVTVLAGAVIDDVFGIVLLAIVLGVAGAAQATGHIHWGHISAVAAKAVGIWLAATAVALLASRRISFLLKLFGDRSSIAIMALGLALVLAGLFEEAGLAMIIGAYVAGLSLSRTDISQVVREKLTPIYALLVPVFFCVMGMLVDFSTLGSARVLIFGAAYTVVAVLAKVIGCGVPALLCGFNLRGALRIGFGMVPRAEVALVIAGIGLAAGVLDPQVFGAAILMMLVTMLIVPPTLVALFRDSARGTRKPVKGEERAVVRFEFASPEIVAFLLGKLVDVFESEGFFVHLLQRQRQIYQLRKDSAIIGLQPQGSTLVFTCDEAETHFVNTAVYEVLGELERTVRGLQKPVDKAAILRRIQEVRPVTGHKFNLAGYLRRDLMEPRLKAQDKLGIIDELLDMLHRDGVVKDIEVARRAILAREESLPTGMEQGIAIPHGRTDAVDRLVCAIGIRREGVDFSSFDEKPSRIIVLTLAPNRRPAPHVQFMSSISQVLMAEARERLLACNTPEEMYAVLTGQPTPALVPSRPVREPAPKPVSTRPEISLARYLRPELLALEPPGDDKVEVIETLLGLLHRSGLVGDLKAAREAVLTREKEMATGIENGLAIPHGRTDAVDDLVCAIAIKRQGVDFGARGGELSRIIILTLSPADHPVPHIQFMSLVSRTFRKAVCDKALAARTRSKLYELLVGEAGT